MTDHSAPYDQIETAKRRVARRAELRKEAAERGRLLPTDYRENLRQQFEAGEEEARLIIERVIGRPAPMCAHPMRAGRWCRRPAGHGGDHEPSTRHIDPSTGRTAL